MGAAAENITAESAQTVRRHREERGWTIEESCFRSGVAYGTWRGIEGARNAPSMETILRMAFAFGVEPNDLMPPSWRDIVGAELSERFGRLSASLPQESAANSDAQVVAIQGKGGKGRSSTASTAAARTIRSAARMTASRAGASKRTVADKRKRSNGDGGSHITVWREAS